MTYLFLLPSLFMMQVVAWLVTPLLPLLAEERFGPTNNNSSSGAGPRLPLWLSWFDTQDNSLDGDDGHASRCAGYPAYLRHLLWLYRNSLYGFRIDVLGYYYCHGITCVWSSGNSQVNRNNGITGTFWCVTDVNCWQWKCVKKLVGDFGIMFNFGWQLDDLIREKKSGMAMLQFSPRFVRIK